MVTIASAVSFMARDAWPVIIGTITNNRPRVLLLNDCPASSSTVWSSLDATNVRDLTTIDRASYDSAMGMPDRNEAARKWSFRALLPKRTDESDAFVEMWKRAWMSGADASWATDLAINPHADDPARAAWQAGSDWAKDHPDRRTRHHLRLAHSNRRATDPGRRIPRAVKIGVVGVGLLAASRWVWRTLRRRKPNSTIADSS